MRVYTYTRDLGDSQRGAMHAIGHGCAKFSYLSLLLLSFP